MGRGAGGRSTSPPRNTETTLVVFLLCHCSVLLSLAVLVVRVAFVAFVLPFVFAALVVCAAGGVLHVVVACCS